MSRSHESSKRSSNGVRLKEFGMVAPFYSKPGCSRTHKICLLGTAKLSQLICEYYMACMHL